MITIEKVSNGYIVTTLKAGGYYEKEVFSTFEEVANSILFSWGERKIGEKVKLVREE